MMHKCWFYYEKTQTNGTHEPTDATALVRTSWIVSDQNVIGDDGMAIGVVGVALACMACDDWIVSDQNVIGDAGMAIGVAGMALACMV